MKKIKETHVIFLVLLLALAMRLLYLFLGYSLSFSELQDQQGALQYALTFEKNILEGQHRSPSMFGSSYLPGPWQNILFYSLFKLSKFLYGHETFQLGVWLIIILNLIWIYRVYRLVKLIFSTQLAIVTCLFCAIFPFSVKYGSTIWNPNFIPLLITLFVQEFYLLIIKKKNNHLLHIILLFSLMIFFHFIVLYTVPIIIFVIIHYRVKIDVKTSALGLFLVFVLFCYYLYNDYVSNFQNTKNYFTNIQNRNTIEPESLRMFSNIFLITTLEISQIIGSTIHDYKYYMQTSFGIFFYAVVILIILSIIISFLGFSFFFNFNKRFKPLVDDLNTKHNWLAKYIEYEKNTHIIADNNYTLTLKKKWLFAILFTFGPHILFLLTFKMHWMRYSVISFPFLFMVPALGFYAITNSNIFKKCKIKGSKEIFFVIFFIAILLINYGFIISSHKSNYKSEDGNIQVRLIPSILFIEKLYYLLLDYQYTNSLKSDNNEIAFFIGFNNKNDILSKRNDTVLHVLKYYFNDLNNYRKLNNLTPVIITNDPHLLVKTVTFSPEYLGNICNDGVLLKKIMNVYVYIR